VVSTLRLFVLATAIVWLAFAARALYRAAAPLGWSNTVAEVISAHSQQVFVGTYIGRMSNSPMYEDRFYITYQYVVAGRTFLGTRVDAYSGPGRKYPLTGERRYPVGAKVSARYNPRAPEEAVLQVSMPWSWLGSFVLAIVLGWLTLFEWGAPSEDMMPAVLDV
jgi:uncharacterized protein DUF3592